MSNSSWFWPRIGNLADAAEASNQGFWAALAVAGITTIFATITLLDKKEIAGINPLAYIDAALFAIVAWRIRRRSRVFAVIGLCLFILEKIVQFSTQPKIFVTGWILALVLTILFINGTRGTFAYHRLLSKERGHQASTADA